MSGIRLPARHPSSLVIRYSQAMSFIRSDSASALNPPKTTVNGAPIRASASIAIGSSGIIPMYTPTCVPRSIPICRKAFAARTTSSWRSWKVIVRRSSSGSPSQW